MASGLADHLFRAFEKIPDQRIERIPPPANRDVDGIIGVEEGPEHDAGRASELGAGGKDRHALSGKDEAERRVNRLDPVRDRHADLMPPGAATSQRSSLGPRQARANLSVGGPAAFSLARP